MAIATINPATGETLRSFEALTDAQLDEKIALSARAFREWRRVPFAERSRVLRRAAEILEAGKREFGALMTTEMGKTLKAAIQEVEKSAWVCRFYAESAERLLAEEVVETTATLSYVRFDPVGVVLAVMPWNFPFWQVFRFAAPALMAGNVGLLKHASNVPQSALAVEEIFRRAGFPEGVFQTLLVGSDKVARVIDDARVAAVTLTGSEPAGRSVAAQAGKQIKKTVLELGGSDPFVVMPSADLDEAVATAVKARNINNGQSCIAAKRFIVHERIADEFERRFVEGLERLKVGDPMNEATDLGPLATRQILEDLDEQVRKSVEAGARLLTGGRRLEGPGNFYAPTALARIPEAAPAYREELFGPVASLFRVRDLEEAIRLANDSVFGLGSSVWTNDEAERRRFVAELEAGSVYVNAMVASDPRLPFGGVKRSGYGRELGGYGIREFVNIKTVWIKDDGGGNNHGETE
ncbi:MAG TPA: NAD-dependent succinate-semialdehyde dehydrogenase [Pyrinomonadaceae bacterium]|nr:NAD-dependent succinate-semialdehyde dehydrogenase [Pyrinomonadaceae bacterium]